MRCYKTVRKHNHSRNVRFNMMLKAKFRKVFLTAVGVTIVCLSLILVVVPAPDLSQENEVLRKIADLEQMVNAAHETNVVRHSDLQRMWKQFSSITKRLQQHNKNNTIDAISKELKLSNEGRALLAGTNWTFDLSLPSIVDTLPHLGHVSNMEPAYKLSRSRGFVSMTLGIPTVKRGSQSYLEQTLKSIFDNMSEADSADTLVILMVAEPYDIDHVKKVAESVTAAFKAQLASGLLEIIAPPAEFYPDMSNLRQTFGDPADRIQWRSKQNLDYAYLMMYAKQRSTYYVQLEDDVLTKKNFVKTMKDAATEWSAQKRRWFVIDFCQLGFIGKLFKSSSLPVLIQFFLAFYNDKPVDWLLIDVIQTMVCAPSQNANKCKEEREQLKIQYKPSLFQHIGTHSSLKGKVQNLRDKQFGKVPLFTAHKNPPAAIETNIRHYKRYSISRAYRGESFYWGLVPQAGDFITMTLTPPVKLSEVRFVSGNVEHPHDKFVATDIDVLFDQPEKVTGRFGAAGPDSFVTVTSFDDKGVAEAKDLEGGGLAHAVRIKIRATSSENWVILSEISLKSINDHTS